MGKFLKSILPILYLIWQTVFSIIRFAGDIDFIVERTKKLGWIGIVINYLIEIHPLLQIAIIFLCFGWLYLVLIKPKIKSSLAINHKIGEKNYYCESFGWPPDIMRKISSSELYRTVHDLHRISVENLSKHTAERVEVEITKIEPSHFRIEHNIPIKLRFMSDFKEHLDEFTNISPKDEIFVNVIQWGSYTGSDYNFEILNSENKDTRFKFQESEEYVLTIKASVKDKKPAIGKFKINYTNKVGEKLKLSFERVN